VSKATPGPWEVAHEPPGFAIVGPLPDRFVVAHIPMHSNERIVTADAQLVAAAPDLFQALEAMVILAERGVAPGAVLAQARAAIAKATGDSP
jgi:hypothetical protein